MAKQQVIFLYGNGNKKVVSSIDELKNVITGINSEYDRISDVKIEKHQDVNPDKNYIVIYTRNGYREIAGYLNYKVK